jgi:hypothetical protein
MYQEDEYSKQSSRSPEAWFICIKGKYGPNNWRLIGREKHTREITNKLK